jgi:hypothetical protein
MKNVIKSMLAIVLVLAMLLSLSVSVFAATKDEAYEAAVQTGAPAQNLVELKNYLNAVSFTAAEYDMMVDAAQRARNIVNSYSVTMFGVVPSKMTEEQKIDAFKAMDGNTRAMLINLLVSLGDDVGVKVEVDYEGAKKGYSIAATDKNGKVVVSSTSKPVVDTSVDYTMAVTFVGVVLALCVMAAVVLGKKARFDK